MLIRDGYRGHILDEYGRVSSYRELDGNSYKYVGKMSSIPRDWNKVDDVDQDLSRVNQDGKLLIHGIFYLCLMFCHQL